MIPFLPQVCPQLSQVMDDMVLIHIHLFNSSFLYACSAGVWVSRYEWMCTEVGLDHFHHNLLVLRGTEYPLCCITITNILFHRVCHVIMYLDHKEVGLEGGA